MGTISKIVVTGGPCAGKTTAMSWIQNNFTQRGYTVLFVPETATEFITGGVAPWTCGTNVAYQKCQVKLQMVKEQLFEQAARTMPGDKILIVCDRGALDNKAYMTQAEFNEVLEFVHSDEITLRDNYDAVFHLVTAAKGAQEFYTTANNAARIETVDQAIALDDKIIASWTGHPHLRVIDNATDFEVKMERLITEIAAALGEPALNETDRKFLIEYPDIQWLESTPNCQRVEVIQTYLKSSNSDEVRVRQRGTAGHYIYFQTTRSRVNDHQWIETERRLSQEEYLTLLMDADTTLRQIRKTRYCLTYGNQYFEIDVYPFWHDQAIANIETSKKEDDIRFPEQLHVIREVTGDERYMNAALARRTID